MRVFIIFLVAIPFISTAQINRSNTEYAKEKIEEYIVTKIFKGSTYKPVSYGKLESKSEPRAAFSWSILHRFEIIDTQYVSNQKVAVPKPYYFSFYLDKKLNIITAESYDFDVN